jgi:replicative DNA helicase
MSDDDWTLMARRMSEISEAPLFIDDSPNLTLMEIRAKARRLKQRNDLKLVILDYLQLMSSGRKVESRQQEVSEFSRQIKLLAKELVRYSLLIESLRSLMRPTRSFSTIEEIGL